MANNHKSMENLISEIERIGRSFERCIVVYNDDYHMFDDVVAILKAATGKTVEEVYDITLEAHMNGHAVCFSGDMEECERIADILREAGLLVEVE